MKTINITIFSFLLAISITSNAIASDLQFQEDFEAPSDKLSKWRGAEAEGPRNIEFVTSPVRKGKRAIAFRILAGQGKTNMGVRSEISYDNLDEAGSETWYAWSFLIPKDFKDAPSNLWQAMGQWHDQPNRRKGETWKSYKKKNKAHSPPVAVYFGTTQANKVPPNIKRNIKNFDRYVVNGKISGISVVGGIRNNVIDKPFAFIPIIKGEWNDIMFHIKWSTGNDGFVELFHNDNLIGKTQMRNMWNNYPHYLKLGLYRSPKIRHESVVYYDEVRIGKTRGAVSIVSNGSGSFKKGDAEIPIGQSTRVAATANQSLGNLQKGDQVVTRGGIHGIVRRLQDDFVILEISRNVKIKVNRNAIVSIQ